LLESIISKEEDFELDDDLIDDPDQIKISRLIDIEKDAEDGSNEAVRDEEEIVSVFVILINKEKECWKTEVKPICSALYKVSLRWLRGLCSHDLYQQCHITFKIINSPILLLPQWHTLLQHEVPTQFHSCTLPRDISTHWNSTFNHLAAFIELETYVDKFTSAQDHGLRDLKLTKEEWECIKQLVKVLQVS